MLTVNEAMQKMKRLNSELKHIINEFGNELDNVQRTDDLDDTFIRDELYQIQDKLDDVSRKIEYMSKPITEQGYIRHNSDGRYELPSGRYFTSGSSCEILTEDYNDEQYWVYTNIEHNGEDYYATALGRDKSINGRMVRVRG